MKMKRMLALSALCLLIGMSPMTVAGRQSLSKNAGVQDQLVGAWRLAWIETEGADGKVHRLDSSGLLVFTRDGHMSVQVMERNPPAQSADASEKYAQGGYEASFGTYQVDGSAHTFTFHVEGALVRTLIGKDLPRAFEFSGRQLLVASTRPEEHWRVAWERH